MDNSDAALVISVQAIKCFAEDAQGYGVLSTTRGVSAAVFTDAAVACAVASDLAKIGHYVHVYSGVTHTVESFYTLN